MSETVKSILKGALLAGIGAVITALTQAVPAMQLSPALLPFVAGGLSVLANVVRKYFVNPAPTPAPGPAPGPTPDPVPAPVNTGHPILDAILAALADRLKAGDVEGAAKAWELASSVAGAK